jgi:ABC-type multidrug transport system permease subunit
VFCFGEIIAEVPYLIICAFLFWATWYPTAGLDMSPGAAGPVFLQMTLYEFLYTGMGQFIAAYAPNPVFAAMVIPLFISTLTTFAGVMIPYMAITEFWRYWLYYLNPFTYLMQGLLTFPLWNVKVQCKESEYGLFDPPAGQTCGEYLQGFMSFATGYVNNPNATSDCQYCGYKQGNEYLASMNIFSKMDGWKGILITLLFVFTSYATVFLLLKLRSKKSKTAQ